jgi:hypothetical protein
MQYRAVAVLRAVILGACTMLACSCGGGSAIDATLPSLQQQGSHENFPPVSQYIYVASSDSQPLEAFRASDRGNVRPQFTLPAFDSVVGGADGHLYGRSQDTVTEYSATAAGTLLPVRAIPCAQIGFAFAVDTEGTLYFSHTPDAPGDIVAFPSARKNCDAPARRIFGPRTGIGDVYNFVVDRTNTLYAANYTGDAGGVDGIIEFAFDANGNVAPLRTIAGPHTHLKDPQAVAVGPDGTIYAIEGTSGANGTIAHLYEYAAGANGDATPARAISGPHAPMNADGPLAVANDGTLYVAAGDASGNNFIEIYAPGANGDVAPEGSIRLRTLAPVQTQAIALTPGAGCLASASSSAGLRNVSR